MTMPEDDYEIIVDGDDIRAEDHDGLPIDWLSNVEIVTGVKIGLVMKDGDKAFTLSMTTLNGPGPRSFVMAQDIVEAIVDGFITAVET